MLIWLYDLFFHRHQWNDIQKENVTNKNEEQIGILYIQQCSICKKYKSQYINAYS